MRMNILKSIIHVLHTIYKFLKDMAIALAEYVGIRGASGYTGTKAKSVRLLHIKHIFFICFVIASAFVVVFSESDITTLQDVASPNQQFNGNITVENVTGPSNTGQTTGSKANVNAATVITVSADQGTGYYYDSVNVNLIASGKHSPLTIYYTTDGSSPTTSSPVYTGPLHFTATTTLKYIAEDSRGNLSPVYTQKYQVASYPTGSANPSSGTYAFIVPDLEVNLFGFNGFSPLTIYYTTDGSDPTTSSLVYTGPLHLTDWGTTNMKFIVVDKYGAKSPIYSYDYYITAF